MLRLRTLGILSLESAAGAHVAAAQRARLALLARLAIDRNGGVSREQLQALFWPESDATRARGALNQALYALRREWDAPDLVLGTTELRLNPALITTDVGEFVAALRDGDLERAVACYGGEFLAGVHLRNGEFERWRDGEADRFARQHREALHSLAAQAEARGDDRAAIHWWTALASADLLSARATLGLMHALVRVGETAAAVHHGRAYARLVDEELATPPDAAVTRLLALLTDREPAPPRPARAPEPSVDETRVPTPPEPTVPSGSVSRRRWLRRAAVAAALFALALAFRPPDTDAVRLRIDAGADAAAASALRMALETAVLVDASGMHVARGWPDRARYTVTAMMRTVGDSVHLTARLMDRVGAHSRTLPARAAHAAEREVAMRALGDGVAASLIAARAPLLERWSAQASLPLTVAGVRAVEEAMLAWRPPAFAAARPHLERAMALDPTSGAPVVLLAVAHAKAGDARRSDATLDRLGSAQRLGPWERAMVAVVRAWNRNDLATAHAAGHRLMEVVPRTEWMIVLAYDALGVGRAREALALLDEIPDSVAWTTRWRDITQNQSLMLAGDFAAALAAAERGLRAEPEDRFFEQAAVKALAALGRVADVEAICTRSLSQRFNQQPCDQAARELRSRGHLDAARRVTERYLRALAATDSLGTRDLLLEHAWGAVGTADWKTLEALLAELERLDGDPADLKRLRLYATASRADRSRVRQLIEQDSTLALIERASLLALSGDRDGAVDGVAAALRAGFRLGFSIQLWPGFEPLRGYAPLESLITPVEDPAHWSAVARVVAESRLGARPR